MPETTAAKPVRWDRFRAYEENLAAQGSGMTPDQLTGAAMFDEWEKTHDRQTVYDALVADGDLDSRGGLEKIAHRIDIIERATPYGIFTLDLVRDVRALMATVTAERASFELRWAADMRAIKRWQEAHRDQRDVWPDHADLVVWLLEQLERVQASTVWVVVRRPEGYACAVHADEASAREDLDVRVGRGTRPDLELRYGIEKWVVQGSLTPGPVEEPRSAEVAE